MPITGELDQQRNVHGFVIEKKTVAFFPVLAEGFAVVGDDPDDGFVVNATSLQRGE